MRWHPTSIYPRRGLRWTPEEDAELARLYPQHSSTVLSKQFQRSPDAIRERATVLGVRRLSQRPFTEEDDRQLIALRRAGLSIVMVGKEMGRSKGSIIGRWWREGLAEHEDAGRGVPSLPRLKFLEGAL